MGHGDHLCTRAGLLCVLLAVGCFYAWTRVWPILTLCKDARKSPPYDVGKHAAALITRDAARKAGRLVAEAQETG